MNPRNLISPSEIAELANVSMPTVSNWMRRFEDFPTGRRVEGTKRLRYDKDEVVAWLEGRQLSQAKSRTNTALLSIDRDSRRDFLGSLFATLHNLPEEHRTSLPEVLKEYETLAARSSGLLVNFDLKSASSVVAELLPEYGKRTNSQLADILSEMDSGLQNRMAGEFSTPDALVLFLSALAPSSTQSVVDLASGEGRLLQHFASHKIGHHHSGSDINEQGVVRARQSALLRGLAIDFVVEDVTTLNPQGNASLVVVDPPLNARVSDTAISAGTWPFGPPSPQDLTTVFLQRAIESLEPGGRALVLSTTSLLSRGGGASKLRRNLLQAGVIRGIVALPSKMRKNTGVPLALWILEKPDPHLDTIVMVDASLSAIAELAKNGPVAKATIAELDGDAAGADSTYATTVPRHLLLTRDVDLRPNAWVAKKRDLIEPQEQLNLATRGLESLEQLSLELPLNPSSLHVGFVEPHLVSLGELQEQGRIKLFTNPRASASDGGIGAPVADLSIVLGDREKSSPRRSTDPPGVGRLIEPGDIVVAAAPRGLAATVWQEKGWIAGSGTHVIRVLDSSTNSQFLAAAIQHPRNFAHVDAGALRVQLNIRSFEVPDLPHMEQEKLSVLLEALSKAEAELQDKLTSLSTAKNDVVRAIGTGTLSIKNER